ncbi:hypothetical protein [Profundibacterium mesophilum]|nr:hypothetical protein [Profundibacterium mesophilum]
MALLFAIGAVLALYASAQGDAMRRLALRAAPPQAVHVESYHPKLDLAPADEVAMVAQLDLSSAVPIAYRGLLEPRNALLLPLLAVRPRPERKVARGYVLIPEEAAAAFAQMPGRYMDVLEDRPGGPLVRFGGRVVRDWTLRRTIGAEMRAAGVEILPGSPIIRPFIEGRAAAFLRPDRSSLAVPLFWAAALAALAGLALQAIERRKRAPRSQDAEPLRAMRSRRPLSAKAQKRFAPLAAQNELIHPLQKPQRYGPQSSVEKIASRIKPAPVAKVETSTPRPVRKSG